MPKKSNQAGVKKDAETEHPQALQSSSEAKEKNTSDMSATIPPLSQIFQPTKALVGMGESDINANMITMFASYTDNVSWKRVRLPNGESAYALLFPLANWEIKDGVLKAKE